MSDSPFRFEAMRREDVPGMVAVEKRCFDAPWTAGQFKHELKIPFSRTIVAWEGGGGGCMAGYICRWVVGDEVSILNIAVDPRFRRRGLGRALVHLILEEAESLGAASVTLEVREKNAAAKALYDSLGFSEAGRRPDYYGKDEDAIVMTLRLCDRAPHEEGLCPIPARGVY